MHTHTRHSLHSHVNTFYIKCAQHTDNFAEYDNFLLICTSSLAFHALIHYRSENIKLHKNNSIFTEGLNNLLKLNIF